MENKKQTIITITHVTHLAIHFKHKFFGPFETIPKQQKINHSKLMIKMQKHTKRNIHHLKASFLLAAPIRSNSNEIILKMKRKENRRHVQCSQIHSLSSFHQSAILSAHAIHKLNENCLELHM